MTRVKPAVTDSSPVHLVSNAKVMALANTVVPLLAGNGAGGRLLIESMSNVDYVVHGEIAGPGDFAGTVGSSA